MVDPLVLARERDHSVDLGFGLSVWCVRVVGSVGGTQVIRWVVWYMGYRVIQAECDVLWVRGVSGFGVFTLYMEFVCTA